MAEKRHLFVDQGSTYEMTIDLVDENGDAFELDGYLARASFRKHYESSNAVTITATLDENLSTLTLSLAANSTVSLPAGRYVYDAEIYSGNTVYRIVEGILTLSPEVTR